MTDTMTPIRPLPPKAVYNILNPLLKTVLRSPLHRLMSKHLIVLSVRGRKSGKEYTIPVGYVQKDEQLLVATNSRWARNVRGGAKVGLWLRGKKRTGTATMHDDAAALRDGFQTIIAHAPQAGEIAGISLDANGEPRADEIARARENGFAIIRITLV